MMEKLRGAANNTLIKIILGIIVVAFTLSGVGGYLVSGHSHYAAKVNGKEISYATYESLQADQRAQALQQLINQTLLEQYADKLALTISDQQIKQTIFQTPSFRRDNQFDNERYNSVIHSMGTTPAAYAELVRADLTNRQLISALADSDFSLKGEVDNLAALIAQQRVVRYATIDVSQLEEKQQVTDQEVTGYYQNNTSRFVSAEQFRLEYLEIDATEQKANVSEQQVRDYYTQHKNEFTAPQQNRYRVIQSKTREQAQEVLAQLQKGADFATMAKEKSIDIISAKNGGDQGWTTEETTPEELKQAGLTSKGQLSGVITSSVGYLLVQLDDIRPAQVKPFHEVQSEITSKLEHEQILNDWYALQRKVSEAASNDNSSLNEAAQVAGVKIQQTDWFDRDGLPRELDYAALREAIFEGHLLNDSGKPGGNSDIITTEGDRAFVLRISDHKPQITQPLSDVRPQVIALLKQQKAQAMAQQQADELLVQLRAGKGDTALSAAGLSFGTEQTLTRHDDNPLTQQVFNLAPPASGKTAYGKSQDSQGNVVLLALDKVIAGEVTDEQKTSLSEFISRYHGQLALNALVGSLRDSGSIKINPAIAE